MYQKNPKIKNVNILLVPTVYGHFYFGLNNSILPFLVPKIKNTFHFGPFH